MEDGDENLNICGADADPEKEISKENAIADFNSKMTPNSGQSFGDSNGSSGMEYDEDEEGNSYGFHIDVTKSKAIEGFNAVDIPATDVENVQPEDVEEDIKDDDNSRSEEEYCHLGFGESYDDKTVPATPEDPTVATELTADSTNSLMCLSDIASTLRPNSLPRVDGLDEEMEVDLSESSDEEVESHGASSEMVLQPASALDPVIQSEPRTEVTSVQELHRVGGSECLSESKLLKGVESEVGTQVVDNGNRTECEDDAVVESLDHDESLVDTPIQPCPNGESISSDSTLGSSHPVFNLSGSSNSPINRLSDIERESLTNSLSKEICDSEQVYVDKEEGQIEDNGMSVSENEIQNVLSECDKVEVLSENVSQDVEGSGSVSDKTPKDEAQSIEGLIDTKSMSCSTQENQCNGDIDSDDDSDQGGEGWSDGCNTSGQIEYNPEEGGCSENLEGKRKQTFDDVEAGVNCLSGGTESHGPTKMFKLNHSVAQSNQQSTVEKGCSVRAPCVNQPLDGRSFFPGNIQANSQITEYAQYLGLQPTVKFKCVRCGEKSFSSMMDLKTHQYACLKSHTPSQPNPSPASVPSHQTSSTNFRITRKVYLCSVCGTYYENWNLFLHMREVHKRHICLFCLGMFSQAERLSAHLVAKHNIVEGHYGNVEEFRLSCKGSVFLMCCSCEKVFSEEDSFSNHPCKDRSLGSKSKPSSNTLVSAKSQTSHVFSKSSSSEKSKQSVEGGGSSRPTKQSESKSGKGSAASGRPKQILKVKIPMQPKVQPSIPPIKISKPPPTIQEPSTSDIYQKNGLDSTQPVNTLSDSHLKSKELSATVATQSANDGDFMSNLDRTINSVALGLSSEALEWQQRKNESFEGIQDLEEPSTLPCLDGPVKSDSDSDHNSVLPPEEDENMDSIPSNECPSETTAEIPAEVAETSVEKTEKPPSPMYIPEIEPPPFELPESPQPVSEDLPLQETEVQPLASPPPQEPAMDIAPSPAAPESPSEPALTEQNPAEDDSDIDTDDSDKLSLVVDETAEGAENGDKTAPAEVQEPLESVPSEPTDLPEGGELGEGIEDLPSEEPVLTNETNAEKGPDVALAGEDVPITEVIIEESLEDIPIQALLKECVKALCYVCVYCSHARRIAVNGKQLALHTLAEHRFSPVDGSDRQDPPPCTRFISRLKDSVQILQDTYFNTDTYDSTVKTCCLPYDRTYECFQCHFFTRSHKELYIHNRKMHQKTILLCIMCKSNFYSYSELLCHLCPGIYIPQCNVSFHCCMCDVDNLPSAFRLMVHLRKRHHACDVCLEITDDQQKLSSHVWKHKLHHLCYRCGIAYRNKPDITNHLFWKHGTESVLCKKCLQKKWPHVYHFCVPPATFTCEECNSLFTRAVSLRVHKRIHTGEQPHPCLECEEKFISKKLLAKHSLIHRTPVPEEKPAVDEAVNDDKVAEEKSAEDLRDITGSTDDQKEDSKEDASDVDTKETDKKHSSKKKRHKEKEEQKKKVVDVYDLPPLNLSSESDSSDDEAKKEQPAAPPVAAPTFTEPILPAPQPIEEPQPAQVVDGIWDNFQNYKANLEKMESAETAAKNPTPEPQEDPNALLFKIVMMDHDYCAPVDPNKPPEPEPLAEMKEKIEEPVPDAEPVDKANAENIMLEETPSLTPPHSKDDVKSTVSESPSKKKRSPKKKTRRRSSSSSSNSSSGSDSSSCSCGTNCSCSSSSSSDSSSSSSDSDSSSSEGRRRALVRRELRKERALEKKKEEEAAASAAATAAAAAAAPVEEPHIDVMESEPAFRESDLDTTETETDEDFYDERPQKLLEESQAEKRNLLLLASVAPLNNGSGSPTAVQQDPVMSNQQFAVPELNRSAVTGGKKRTKKRKKKQSSHFHSKLSHRSEMPPPSLSVESQQSQQSAVPDMFPQTYYPYTAPSPISPVVQRHPMAPSFQQSTPESNSKRPLVTKLTREVVPHAGSGSETEGRTKRKRMPNKFYGYSSDEEAEESSTHKWRKTETTVSHQPTPPSPVVATIPTIRQPVSPLTLKRTVPSVQEAPPPITLSLTKRSLIVKPDSDSDRVTSSSSSSDSDDDAMQISEGPPTGHASTTLAGDAPVRETNDNLYCYCQCPYDEVSEMIACDGKNCAIEWFHFECVGIMVPPKGQWYCPDCRKNMTGYQGIE